MLDRTKGEITNEQSRQTQATLGTQGTERRQNKTLNT